MMRIAHTAVSARVRVALVGALLLLVAAVATPSSAATPRHSAAHAVTQQAATSPFRAFLRQWYGHDRLLTIRADGSGREVYLSGCCPPVSRYRFQLSHPRRDANGHPVANIRITGIRIDKGGYHFPGVKVGTTGLARIRNHVFRDSIFKVTFCSNGAPTFACGA